MFKQHLNNIFIMDMDMLELRANHMAWNGSTTTSSEPIIVHQNKPGSSDPNPTLVDPSQALQELRALLPTRPDVGKSIFTLNNLV